MWDCFQEGHLVIWLWIQYYMTCIVEYCPILFNSDKILEIPTFEKSQKIWKIKKELLINPGSDKIGCDAGRPNWMKSDSTQYTPSSKFPSISEQAGCSGSGGGSGTMVNRDAHVPTGTFEPNANLDEPGLSPREFNQFCRAWELNPTQVILKFIQATGT